MGIPALVDVHDLDVYFSSSDWVVGGAPLFHGTASEYPLAANLLFAVVRLASLVWHPVSDATHSFEATWVTLGWFAWLAMALALWRWAPHRAVWLWLTPAALYFTLYRFDVYPVAATLAAFIVARQGRFTLAALLFGIAIALKGYALFAVPALAVWVWYERDWREAAGVILLAVAPLAATILLVQAAEGLAAALSPFTVQASRVSNGQSTWDVIAPILAGPKLIQRYRYLPFVLEVATALAAAALRPQSFAAFVRAFIVAIGGFVTFSVFYSPQFYLWFIPPVAFAGSVGMLAPTIALGWVTILYFPVAFLRAYGTVAFRVAVAAVTILRSSLILVAFVSLVRLRATSNAGQTGPAHSN